MFAPTSLSLLSHAVNNFGLDPSADTRFTTADPFFDQRLKRLAAFSVVSVERRGNRVKDKDCFLQ